MALEHLIRALEEDAEGRVRRRLETARAEVDRLLAEAERERGQQRLTRLRDWEKELRREAYLELARARREGRREVLLARERMLDRVLAAAEDRLAALLEQDACRIALGERLEVAQAYMGDEPCVLRASPGLAGELRSHLAGRAGVTVVEEPDLGSGFSLEAQDGSVRVDGTLEALLARLRPVLSLEVVRRVERGLGAGRQRAADLQSTAGGRA